MLRRQVALLSRRLTVGAALAVALLGLAATSLVLSAAPGPVVGPAQATGSVTAGPGTGTANATGTVLATRTVTATGTVTATTTPGPVNDLTTALTIQIQVNTLVSNPAIYGNPTAIRTAVTQAAPLALQVQARLQAAAAEATGPAAGLVQGALNEMEMALGLGQLILTGPDADVPLRHDEMRVHGAVALTYINLALASLGAGPSAPAAGRLVTAADFPAPAGYRVEVVANGLDFPSAVTTGPDGAVYVAEAGFSYGQVRTVPQVRRIAPNGTSTIIASGVFSGPIAGLAVSGDNLFVSHRGAIARVNLTTNAVTNIITGLPSFGEHYNENIAVGPDGKLYITQGTATNMGVVDLNDYFFGWLQQFPQGHDTPCRTLTLAGVNYTMGNPLMRPVTDTVTTGAFLPFGAPSTAGQTVPGQTLCNGAVLQANLDGSGLTVFADGFRNVYGLAFHPDGRLFVTEQGPDDAGQRPTGGPDSFYQVVQGGWYGWPDFVAGKPVTDPSNKPETHPNPQPVLLNPPPLARQPDATFPRHSTAVGFDFSRSAGFAPVGTAFVAQFGDLTPPTASGAVVAAGHQVVMLAPGGTEMAFLTSPATSSLGQLLFRPTDATFSADGTTLYVTHFGEVNTVPGGIAPRPGTGALLRITSMQQVTGTVTPATGTPGTGTPVATGTVTPGTGTPMMTGTVTPSTGTPMMTGTVTPGTGTPMMTSTVTPGTGTPMMTGTVTPGTGTPMMTGTVTSSTGTPGVTGTVTPGTGTPMMTGTVTPGTGTPAVTRTVTPGTGTPAATTTVQPTAVATCDATNRSNVCGGILVIRAFIDFGCDTFFNRGTDWPLAGTTVTAILPDGTRRTAIVDENGNAVITGVNLTAGQPLLVTTDGGPPSPTWVQQAGFGLAACPGSGAARLTTTNFTLFGVAYVDLRYNLSGGGLGPMTVTPMATGFPSGTGTPLATGTVSTTGTPRATGTVLATGTPRP